MSIGWNILGILAWIIIVLYLVFIIQNIRKRHILMIVKYRKRFDLKTFFIDAIEILVLLIGTGYMLFLTFFSYPDLADKKNITSNITYQPLILTAGKKRSYYVKVITSDKTAPKQKYTIYSSGKKISVTSNYATVSYGEDPMSVEASSIPYSTKKLQEIDNRYQKAYVATYTSTYKRNWFNGLGLHAGKIATEYYLIRVPDKTFIKQERN